MRDLIKTACLRARRLEIAIYLYSLARGLRPVYHVKEDSRSRVRRAGSSHQVFGRDAASLYQPYYVWNLGGFLCLTFFIVITNSYLLDL